ncbi:hypothetical protein ACJIZ3_006634 [Penstemon smallii]|uniref:F-box protein n=1 Tax=Penstemon smallii TaxID=265156 RepID=A0ABD3S882_9LAMI
MHLRTQTTSSFNCRGQLLPKYWPTKSKQREIKKAMIDIPRWVTNISLPGVQTREPVKELDLHNINTINRTKNNNVDDPMVMAKIYAILEAIEDRVEMHKNIGEQRTNWNNLLLTSINALTLSAATMVGVAAMTGGAPAIAMKLSSTSMYLAATGMISVMNKIQPSQLAEEQRNAARLFKQLRKQIQTLVSIGNPTAVDVNELMEKVLALDKAYPLPLLGGAMLEKFPENVEPAVWWPPEQRKTEQTKEDFNGWNGKLEEEMREIANVLQTKDEADYLRLGAIALKLNKFLAVTAPVLTGLAAVGSTLVGSPSYGGFAVVMGVVGGALASAVNTVEHGGQVGMVFEMYRSNAGFFKLMQESIEWNLREEELERRDNGEVFEMKVGLKLGRSLSELRSLAAASSVKGDDIDEFASKLF